MAHRVLVPLVISTVRVSQVMLWWMVRVLLVMVLGVGPRMGGRRQFWALGLATSVGWWSVGSTVLVVFLASGAGVAPRQSWRLQLQVLHQVLSRVAVLYVMMLMLRPGGGAGVMLTLVALVMLMMRVLPAVLRVLAPLVMPMARLLQVMHLWMVLW